MRKMRKPTIGGYIAKFRETRNPLYVLIAIILTVQQGRIYELVYGVYCSLFFKPSVVKPNDNELVDDILKDIISVDDLLTYKKRFLSRDQLIVLFSKDFFNIHSLPHEFSGCRNETILHGDNFLILGEYSDEIKDSATIVFVDHERCNVIDYYNHLSGVMHIHSIHKYGDSKVLISTGDTKKLLDLWVIDGNALKFEKRIKKRNGGYLAAAMINGKDFFGTDFSGRPNYIDTLVGQRYFFPFKAYKKYVVHFSVFYERYIVSINQDLPCLGGRKTLSIFDAIDGKFIYCEYLD